MLHMQQMEEGKFFKEQVEQTQSHEKSWRQVWRCPKAMGKATSEVRQVAKGVYDEH